MIKKLKEHIGSPKVVYALVFLVLSILFYFITNAIFSKFQYGLIQKSTNYIPSNFYCYVPKSNFSDILFYSFCKFTPIYVFLTTLILSFIVTNIFIGIIYKYFHTKCESMKDKNINNKVINKNVMKKNIKIVGIFLVIFLVISTIAIYCETILDSGYSIYEQVNVIDKANYDSVSSELQGKYTDESKLNFDFITGKFKDDRLCYQVRLSENMSSIVNRIKTSSDKIVVFVLIIIGILLFYFTIEFSNRDGGYCPVCHKIGAIDNGTVIDKQDIDCVSSQKEKEKHTEKRKWDVDDKWHKLEVEEDVVNTYHIFGTSMTYEHICSHCGQKFQYNIRFTQKEKIGSSKK